MTCIGTYIFVAVEFVAVVGGVCGSTALLWHDVDFYGMVFVEGPFATFYCAEDALDLCHMWDTFGRLGKVAVEMI